MKGLPLAYSKDMQDDKPPVFEAASLMGLSIAAMTGMIAGSTFNTARMRAAGRNGICHRDRFLADWLVREAGIPFREAHHITGSAVKLAESRGLALDQLPLADLKAIDARIDERVYAALSVDASVAAPWLRMAEPRPRRSVCRSNGRGRLLGMEGCMRIAVISWAARCCWPPAVRSAPLTRLRAQACRLPRTAPPTPPSADELLRPRCPCRAPPNAAWNCAGPLGRTGMG